MGRIIFARLKAMEMARYDFVLPQPVLTKRWTLKMLDEPVPALWRPEADAALSG